MPCIMKYQSLRGSMPSSDVAVSGKAAKTSAIQRSTGPTKLHAYAFSRSQCCTFCYTSIHIQSTCLRHSLNLPVLRG
eukprot:3943454-Amphidinium_carterae.1